MATWPTSPASTANLDAGTDRPSLARPDLKTNVDNTNAIIDMFNITASPSNGSILKYSTSTTKFELTADADVNTTYTISAETVSGGANLRLTGSDSSTDDVKIASGTGITVSRTDANTITIASGVTDTNTTYSISAVADGADANIRLTGSDASTDDIQLVAGTNISLAVTSAGAIQINNSASAGMTDFTVAGDSGTSQTVSNGNTLTIAGGTNLNSVASATDTVTLNLDTTVTGLTSLTSTTVVAGTVTTSGATDLVLHTNANTTSGVITIQDGVDGDITVVPNGTGKVHFETSETRVGITNTNAKITTKGTGDLTLDTNSGTNSGSIVIADGVNGNISITPNGTGRVVIDGISHPIADGTANQVLQTNGSGVLSFATQSVAVSTGVTGLGTGVATFLATPSSANLISAVTDETGTGALVFATSPTLTTPLLGTPTSGTLTNCTVDGTNPIGYRDLPAVGTKTSSYQLATGDVGKYVQVGSGGSITIPDATFAEGDVVVIANNHSSAITITCSITTAYIAGTDTDKATVSLATRGLCNILFLSGTACIISGNIS
jgi:hypothetical protein